MQARKMRIDTLVLPEPEIWGRRELNRDAVERYKEKFVAGKSRPLVVQARTLRIIDGVHRYTAAKELGLEEVWVTEQEVPDHEVRALAYKLNAGHGVPYTRQERDAIIARLYFQDGLTQAKIAEVTGLSQQTISEILRRVSNTGSGNLDVSAGDKRVKLRDQDMPAVARLILSGTSHEEVAAHFGVSRATITVRWNQLRDRIRSSYEGGKLKREVAEECGLTVEEVDLILREFGDPVNFEAARGSLWTGFRIDERFGQRHPGNAPAQLIRNLLYFYSRPGDTIVDVFAGGGVVLDVGADMVGRTVYAFDIDPKRPDIAKWDILAGPPPVPGEPDVIFCDPPYGPMKQGQYMPHPSQLADLDVQEFLEAMSRIFTYWRRGRIVLLMACLRKDGRFVALPHECAKRLEAQGWRLVDWLVNEIHRPASETAVTMAVARKNRVPLRSHIDILVAEKP